MASLGVNPVAWFERGSKVLSVAISHFIVGFFVTKSEWICKLQVLFVIEESQEDETCVHSPYDLENGVKICFLLSISTQIRDAKPPTSEG